MPLHVCSTGRRSSRKARLCVGNPHIGLVSGTPWIKQKPGRWKGPAAGVARAWDGPGDASSEPLQPQPRGAATQAPPRPPGWAGHLHRGCGSWDPEQPGYDQATRLARPGLPRSRSRGPGLQSRGPDPSQQAPVGWQVLDGAACRHSAPFQGDKQRLPVQHGEKRGSFHHVPALGTVSQGGPASRAAGNAPAQPGCPGQDRGWEGRGRRQAVRVHTMRVCVRPRHPIYLPTTLARRQEHSCQLLEREAAACRGSRGQ